MAGRVARVRSKVLRVAIAPCVLLLGACAPDARYQPLPASQRLTAGEIEGVWEGSGGARVILEREGRAAVERLGGQEFQFDEEPRITGNGKWEMINSGEYKGGMSVGGGTLIKLTIRPDGGIANSGSQGGGYGEAPRQPSGSALSSGKVTWILSSAGAVGSPFLYYLAGDPDVRDRYVLRKTERSRGILVVAGSRCLDEFSRGVGFREGG